MKLIIEMNEGIACVSCDGVITEVAEAIAQAMSISKSLETAFKIGVAAHDILYPEQNTNE